MGSVIVAIAILGWLIIQSNSPAPLPVKIQQELVVPVEQPVQEIPDDEVHEVPQQQAPIDPVTISLNKINDLIAQHVKKHGKFPVGSVASDQPFENRFSWIAKLNSEFGDATGLVDWEKSWQAPVHDRFVRRRLNEFQNPTLKSFVGEDSLPATHFVGISGYGENAATLPVNHPRAGIFGTERHASQADITDGLANTMLVAGVSRELGSWARSGHSTIRSFTQHPYINGPDGFDTGNPDVMLVLMADGSVKFLNKETEPVIIERMAAMADGLPLDATVVKTDVKTEPKMTDLPQTSGPEELPILVPIAPDKPPFDINKHLQNKVLSYQQTKPTAISIVLQEIEELIGVQLDRTQLTEAQLAVQITVEQTDVTFLDLLTVIIDEAGLRYEVQTQSIKILSPKQL